MTTTTPAAGSRRAGAAMTTRTATATAGPVRCARSRPGPVAIRQAAGVTKRLRCRGGAGAWPHLDEASISEPDRDRPERGGGLDIGLALLLGIELGEGELS